MPRRLRTVVAWNMKVGRGRAAIRDLRSLIRDHRPEVVLLQEAKNYVTAIRVAFPGWRVYGGPGRIDASNCVIMVRRSVRVSHHGRVKNHTPWKYLHNGRSVTHPGRVWRWVQAGGITFLSLHKATNALGLNKSAGLEEADNLIDWFGDHADPTFAAGDWNNQHDDRRPNGPVDIARHAQARIVASPQAGIDFAAVRGIAAVATRGDKYGSDHHATIYRLEKR